MQLLILDLLAWPYPGCEKATGSRRMEAVGALLGTRSFARVMLSALNPARQAAAKLPRLFDFTDILQIRG